MSRDPSTYTFTEDERLQVQEHLDEVRPTLRRRDINLKTDDVQLSGQNYAVIEVVSPESTQKSDHLCLKIKGVFDKLDEARGHAKYLHENDPTFDLYVVSMYEWLLLPPNHDAIADQEYHDETLNTLISEYRENQEKTKIEFNVRKDALKTNPDVNLTPEFPVSENASLEDVFKTLEYS
jgi:hypothetical protein